MTDDMELVREYAATGSEEVFAQIASRHVAMVHSVALRHVRNPHQAEEITQAVFIILAKKAGSLRANTVLSGWLFHTARLTAANFQKMEMRRIRRDQEAYMESLSDHSSETNETWQQISPLLDEAIADLNEKDRNAIVLRFVESKSLREVGVGIGASEDAAKVRVARALEKLRGFFKKRGVVLTGAVLTSAICSNAVQAAPLGLSQTVISAAAFKGAAASCSTLSLTHGTIKIMTWLKLKTAVVVTGAALVAGVIACGVGIAVSNRPVAESNVEVTRDGAAIIAKTQAAYDKLSSYYSSGTDKLTSDDKVLSTTVFSILLSRQNLYKIQWESPINADYTVGGAVWCAGDDHFMVLGTDKPEKNEDRDTNLAVAASVSGNASGTVPEAFFKGASNELFTFASLDNFSVKPDETVGGVDCFVLSGERKEYSREFTLWIGKKDFLIRQRKTVRKDFKVKMPKSDVTTTSDMISVQTYENIRVNVPVSKNDCVYRP